MSIPGLQLGVCRQRVAESLVDEDQRVDGSVDDALDVLDVGKETRASKRDGVEGVSDPALGRMVLRGLQATRYGAKDGLKREGEVLETLRDSVQAGE